MKIAQKHLLFSRHFGDELDQCTGLINCTVGLMVQVRSNKDALDVKQTQLARDLHFNFVNSARNKFIDYAEFFK